MRWAVGWALIGKYRHPSLEKLIGGCEIQEQWFVVALTLLTLLT